MSNTINMADNLNSKLTLVFQIESFLTNLGTTISAVD